MTINWQNFSESELQYPENIVASSIEGFSKATHGMVDLVVRDMTGTATALSFETDFMFRVYIVSPLIPHYRYNILDFGYNVKLNPIYYKIDPDIFYEIYDSSFSDSREISKLENKDFLEELKKIFASKAFTDLVAGLMKIAQKQSPD